ncbi:hypothetical protein [Lentzea flaviverrucosa]|nr:hypothetical protein [Lentzea flaviverrucosa]
MDAGTGTLGPLQRHTRLEDLDAIWISHLHAIWISHLHADHSADLLTAYYALLFADVERDPVPLYGPPGIVDRPAGLLAVVRPTGLLADERGPRRDRVSS